MNQLVYYLLFFISLFFAERAYSSHLYGGEVRWQCTGSGQYVFFVEFYIDCTGITFDSTGHTLSVFGNPLPRDANNNPIANIRLENYSTGWRNRRNGDLSPECRSYWGALSCANQDNGSTKIYLYKSKPIKLKGIPPSTGWIFQTKVRDIAWRPYFENGPIGEASFRAIMYPNLDSLTKNKLNADPCIDISPRFKSLPVNNICRGQFFDYNLAAIDTDLDSLVFSWGRSISYDLDTHNIPYNQGFDYNNPTPDQSFSGYNIPSTLDEQTGLIRMRISSGNGVEKFLLIIKVDSYRNGQKNATVYKELPIAVFDCPDLPNGKKNNPPIAKVNGKLIEGQTLEFMGGEKIILPITVSDSDYINPYSLKGQVIQFTPNGLMLTEDRTSSTPCGNVLGGSSLVEPCAYFNNSLLRNNQNSFPTGPSLKANAFLQTHFIWQTDCDHIGEKTEAAGTNSKTYQFVMRVSDDHCPTPAINYPTLSIKVKDPYPLEAPLMKGIDVGLDGSLKYQWIAPIDSNNLFKAYLVEFSTAPNLQSALWEDTLNRNLEVYQHSNVSELGPIYTSFDPPKINESYRDNNFYVRMSTRFLICNKEGISLASDPVKIIHLKTSVKSNSLNKQEVTLSWNSPKIENSSQPSYLNYESKTKYYLWRNDSMNLRTSKNWRLIGETTKTNITIDNDGCGEFAAFRVEARDTVAIRGYSDSTMENNELDTLTFSSSSLIDTLIIKPDKTPPSEFRIDLLSYNAITSDIKLQWSKPNPGDIDSLIFITDMDFNSNPPTYRVIGKEKWDIVSKQFKVGLNLVDARSEVKFLGAIAKDKCGNLRLPSIRNIYNTIDVEVNWEACDSSMYINWNEYKNFSGNDLNYVLYLDSSGSGNFKKVDAAERIETTRYRHKIYKGNKVYRYLVKAEGINLNGLSVKLNSNIDSANATYEDQPKFGEITNVSVVNSNYIQLNYLLDQQTPVKNYVIYRGLDSNNLTQIESIPRNLINSYEYSFEDYKVDVNNHSYFYQVIATNYCDLKFHDSNFGTSILLNVQHGESKLKNVLQWNSYEKWEGKVSHYNVYRGIDQIPKSSVYHRIEKVDKKEFYFVDDLTSHSDAIGEYCYQVEAVKLSSGTLSENIVSKSNMVCLKVKPLFYVPNAFAPNGVNNEFLPKGQFINHAFYEMKIFDRYGNELFRSNDITKGWDGRQSGNIVQVGSYVYMIQFTDAEGNQHLRKGTVTVIR